MPEFFMSTNEVADRNDPQHVWARVQSLAAPEAYDPLEAAYALAARAHRDQWRKVAAGQTPIPYIVHPLRVAAIVAGEWGCNDGRTLVTCLLHDVLEDVGEQSRSQFSQEIR